MEGRGHAEHAGVGLVAARPAHAAGNGNGVKVTAGDLVPKRVCGDIDAVGAVDDAVGAGGGRHDLNTGAAEDVDEDDGLHFLKPLREGDDDGFCVHRGDCSAR